MAHATRLAARPGIACHLPVSMQPEAATWWNTVRKATDAALVWGNLLPRCPDPPVLAASADLGAAGVTAVPP